MPDSKVVHIQVEFDLRCTDDRKLLVELSDWLRDHGKTFEDEETRIFETEINRIQPGTFA